MIQLVILEYNTATIRTNKFSWQMVRRIIILLGIIVLKSGQGNLDTRPTSQALKN